MEKQKKKRLIEVMVASALLSAGVAGMACATSLATEMPGVATYALLCGSAGSLGGAFGILTNTSKQDDTYEK